MANPTVCRVRPLTRGALVGADSHQLRKHANVHVDEKRSVFNKLLIGSGNIEDDVKAILQQVPLANKKTTAVAAEMILTVHHEYFDRIAPNWRKGEISPAMQKWIDKSLRFLEKEHGKGVASVTLHLDESAPHLHCVIVPVATYDISFRRGSKLVTRVNYRKLFADPMEVLIEAQRANRSDTDTKLGRLQTRYADAVGDLGLVRGLRNSKATHQEIREFQRLLKEPAPVNLNVNFTTKAPKHGAIQIKLPPVPGLLDRGEAKLDQVMIDSAGAGITAFRDGNAAALNQMIAKAKDYDRAVKEADRLKKLVRTSDERAVAMQSTITQLNDELALSKDEIAKLRGIDTQRVAEALGFEGARKWKNAIDMVMQVEGMDYKNAVVWLHSEFGLEATVATAADFQQKVVRNFVDERPSVPLTKRQAVKVQQVTKQLDGLGAEKYRITMMSDVNPTYNVGRKKGEDETERFYTAAEVVAMVPQLEKKNQKEKYQVYVTPIDKAKHFVVVDDVTPEALEAMKAEGYRPNQVLESSRKNMQAIFIVDKAVMSKEVGNAVFKGLNKQFGDTNIQGFVHPFRLAAFANVKDKHRDATTGHYPFVRLLEQARAACSRIIEFGKLIADQTMKPHMNEETAAKQVRQVLTDKASLQALISDPGASAPTALRQMAETHYQCCEWRWGADMNRSVADFMFIKRALASGYKAEQIASTLSIQSPELAIRHPDVAAYVGKSIDAARQAVETTESETDSY